MEVNSESLFLSANDVEVSSTDSSIIATGDVKFQDELYLITSDYLSAARENDNLIATATNANYHDYSVGLGGANGFTEVIKKTPTTVLLTNSTYSLCPVNKNDWLIEADEIELNLARQLEERHEVDAHLGRGSFAPYPTTPGRSRREAQGYWYIDGRHANCAR